MRDFETFFHKNQLDALHKGIMRYRYRDVLCQKSPMDVAIYMRLIWDARPGTIIEIGSKAGGTALLFRDLARMADIDCHIVSIDARPPPIRFEGISFLEGDVLSLRQTFRRHKLRSSPRPWLVIASSAHTLAACTVVLEFFEDVLREGDYLVAEDGAMADLDPTGQHQGGHHGGPNAAISKYIEARPSIFEIVTDYCDMFGRNATSNPNGYLRRLPANAADEARRREEEEVVRGEVPYLEALKSIHRLLSPSLYLEIGVSRGHSLRLAQCRAIGVDPAYRLDFQLPPGTTFVNTTSDDFFKTKATKLLAGDSPDLVFIDGMHHFEYALRDFMNAERLASAHSLIVIDDIIPNHPAQAARARRTRHWTGDVWKLRAVLREHRPDLHLLALDTSPVGMLMVGRLNPANRILTNRYASIVRTYRRIAEPPPAALSRDDAVSPNGREVKRFIARLRSKGEPKTRRNAAAKRKRRRRADHGAS